MSREKRYTTTRNGATPTGYKRKGTYRDVSLVTVHPDLIEDFDRTCIEAEMTRSQLLGQAIRSKYLKGVWAGVLDAIPQPIIHETYNAYLNSSDYVRSSEELELERQSRINEEENPSYLTQIVQNLINS